MNHSVDNCQLYLNGQLVSGYSIEDDIKVEPKNRLRMTDMGLLPKEHPDYDQDVIKVESDYATFYLKKGSDSHIYLMDLDEHKLIINYKGESMSDKELYMKLLEEVV